MIKAIMIALVIISVFAVTIIIINSAFKRKQNLVNATIAAANTDGWDYVYDKRQKELEAKVYKVLKKTYGDADFEVIGYPNRTVFPVKINDKKRLVVRGANGKLKVI